MFYKMVFCHPTKKLGQKLSKNRLELFLLKSGLERYIVDTFLPGWASFWDEKYIQNEGLFLRHIYADGFVGPKVGLPLW